MQCRAVANSLSSRQRLKTRSMMLVFTIACTFVDGEKEEEQMRLLIMWSIKRSFSTDVLFCKIRKLLSIGKLVAGCIWLFSGWCIPWLLYLIYSWISLWGACICKYRIYIRTTRYSVMTLPWNGWIVDNSGNQASLKFKQLAPPEADIGNNSLFVFWNLWSRSSDELTMRGWRCCWCRCCWWGKSHCD